MHIPRWLSPREWFAATTRPAGVPVVARLLPQWQQGKPLPLPFDVQAFATEGYRQNIIVAACLWEIIGSASEPELRAVKIAADGSETILPTTHPLAQIVARPNPEMSMTDLLERLLLHQHIGGQWFLHKARSQRGRVAELWPLRPDRVSIITPGASGLIDAFAYRVEGGSLAGQRYPAADIIQGILRPDYLDDFNGLPVLASVARWIDLDNRAGEYLRAFFTNGGQPAGLLKFKHQADPHERERLRDQWRETYGLDTARHITNFHNLAILDADVEYQELGSRPSKLGMQPIFDQTESRICATFNIPPVVIAVRVGLQYSTFANYEEARASLWDETLKPLYRKVATKLTVGLAREFGPDLALRFNFDEVQALQEANDSRRAFALDGYTGGILTLNEAREILGKPPIEGDEGTQRAPSGGGPSLGDLFGRRRRREQHTATRSQRTAITQLMAGHFQAQGEALLDHLRTELDQEA